MHSAVEMEGDAEPAMCALESDLTPAGQVVLWQVVFSLCTALCIGGVCVQRIVAS